MWAVILGKSATSNVGNTRKPVLRSLSPHRANASHIRHVDPAVGEHKAEASGIQIVGLLPLRSQVARQALEDARRHWPHHGNTKISGSGLGQRVQCGCLINDVVAHLHPAKAPEAIKGCAVQGSSTVNPRNRTLPSSRIATSSSKRPSSRMCRTSASVYIPPWNWMTSMTSVFSLFRDASMLRRTSRAVPP